MFQIKELWKTSYKLMKRFQPHPGPLKAAATIKSKLEKFKINMPLITALCNPGLKSRHWELMSKKVGFVITENRFYIRHQNATTFLSLICFK